MINIYAITKNGDLTSLATKNKLFYEKLEEISTDFLTIGEKYITEINQYIYSVGNLSLNFIENLSLNFIEHQMNMEKNQDVYEIKQTFIKKTDWDEYREIMDIPFDVFLNSNNYEITDKEVPYEEIFFKAICKGRTIATYSNANYLQNLKFEILQNYKKELTNFGLDTSNLELYSLYKEYQFDLQDHNTIIHFKGFPTDTDLKKIKENKANIIEMILTIEGEKSH